MKKILRISANAFCVIVCALFLLVLFVNFSGAKGYAVASNSMQPSFNRGDAVFVRKIDFESLKEGDVVTVAFKSGEGTYTHRIVSIDYDKKQLKTAGDNTGVVDIESASENQILGKVWFSVPLLGYFSLWLTDTSYAAAIVLMVLIVMLVSFLVKRFYKNKTRGDVNEHSKEKNG